MEVIDVPIKQIPPFRYKVAMDAGIKKIMMTTWGGLGDQVCGEPALRYAFKLFPDYEISLLTSFPELFTHLPFKRIYAKAEAPSLNDDDWLVLHTNHPHENMARDFLAHHFTQCVDFSSLCAFQRQLPIADRQVMLPKTGRPVPFDETRIVVHAGRHWQSKSFPSAWWSEVLARLCDSHDGVCLVGKDVDEHTGTVEVQRPKNCLDLRNRLSLLELSTVLQEADVVVTNDSAPLHMAAAGDAHILFVATCKEPDHLMHWRRGKFGWRMENLGLDGLWNHVSTSPIRDEPLRIDVMPEGLLERCLPLPRDVAGSVTKALRSE